MRKQYICDVQIFICTLPVVYVSKFRYKNIDDIKIYHILNTHYICQYLLLQLSASDADQGLNSRILYHIVDGNPDNAFTISPPYSGVVRTNIVLDREIREKYRLTIIATDQGNPQLTGTAALSVRVIDVNDNQPTFPEHSIISVSEGKSQEPLLP
ncbi:PREDICTED: protein dachsous-like [Vollenhovia emeryi]|uniref:protein dachsous-like n=1 Tax=Vollenhovia emeryi TaxID=411798 RepID=UPI0005F576D2|nr:PREDICTED: protein dachsous-like [Vollenhovia emeryi]